MDSWVPGKQIVPFICMEKKKSLTFVCLGSLSLLDAVVGP